MRFDLSRVWTECVSDVHETRVVKVHVVWEKFWVEYVVKVFCGSFLWCIILFHRVTIIGMQKIFRSPLAPQ